MADDLASCTCHRIAGVSGGLFYWAKTRESEGGNSLEADEEKLRAVAAILRLNLCRVVSSLC